jgi:type III restriction enzyme
MIAGFAPKTYQSQVLESITAYFESCHEERSPSLAFTATTERLWGRGLAYNPLSCFPSDMPYFCLRVPTGGGKTWLAAKSVALVNRQLLRCEHSVILWLVPSKPIREQTLRALRDRQHPYHVALREAGPVTVMDLEEAKSVTRATMDTATLIIVATRQAFQVEDEECRKVYQSSGALMHHFENLAAAQRNALLGDGEGAERVTPCLLANVLRSVSAAELKAEEIVVATGEENGFERIDTDYRLRVKRYALPSAHTGYPVAPIGQN